MAATRYFLAVDDEPGILESYKQYLVPPAPAAGSALDRLRKLKGAAGAPPRAAGILLPGWELVTAGSGEQALEVAAGIADRGDEICVGFFDVKMPPGIDGIETMLRLLKIFPRMRCGIVSAYNDRTVDEINALFDPAHQDRWDFISKPFTEPEIRQKARMLVGTWVHADEAAIAHERRREALEELAKVNAELEDRVVQRTRELSVATEMLARSEARMRVELEAAAAIQMNFYPQVWPPDMGVEFASHIEPTAETGGDICGFVLPGNGEIGVYICDVTGHGASAALGTAILCGTLKAIEQEAQSASQPRLSPGDVLRRLNAVLRHAMRGSLFATFFLGMIDVANRRMRYASAGHEWPLVARGSATTVIPLLASSVLGDLAEPHYPDLEAPLGPGDVLLLYTDGLTDARDQSGRPFDRRRLFKALAGAPKESASAVKAAIDAAFRAVVPSGSPLEDDITYVITRVIL